MSIVQLSKYGRMIIWALIIYIGISGIAAPLVLSSDHYYQVITVFSGAYAEQEAVLSQSAASNTLHRVLGLIVLIAGMMQLNSKLRDKHRALHRWSGRIYITLSIITVITASILAVRHAFGGLSHAIFVLFTSALFLLFIASGWRCARKNNFERHSEWMILGFAVLMSVAVQRPFFMAASMLTDIHERSLFLPTGILGLIISLLAAQWWIHKARRVVIAPSNTQTSNPLEYS